MAVTYAGLLRTLASGVIAVDKSQYRKLSRVEDSEWTFPSSLPSLCWPSAWF